MKRKLLLSIVAIISLQYASAQCSASFTTTDNGAGNYTFTNTSTGVDYVEWWIDGNMLYTSWDANHTFSIAGNHNVWLYCYDSLNGFCDSSALILNVNLNGCAASFTTVDNGGGNYDFTNTSIGTISNVEWWINGNMTYTTWNANHTFPVGTHDVCLYTYDPNFCDSTCQTVIINAPPPCQASFWWVPDSMNQFLVWVINTSTGNNQTYLWDFGDNTTSTLQYPTHTYAGPGPYTLCLTVTCTNPAGTDIICQTVTLKTGVQGMTINVVPPGGVGISTASGGIEVGSLFPNPASNMAYLPIKTNRSLNLKIEMSNIIGQMVYSKMSYVPAGGSQIEIPVMQLTKGSYLIRIVSEDASFSRTIRLMKAE